MLDHSSGPDTPDYAMLHATAAGAVTDPDDDHPFWADDTARMSPSLAAHMHFTKNQLVTHRPSYK
jgi:hypothetical protein